MTLTEEFRVVIIGCGLGGLSCAIECLKQGFEVTALEKAPRILPIGAGIMVPPNAMKVLRLLGVADQMMQKGAVELEAVRYMTYDSGDLLYQKPVKNCRKDYGDPWCVVHRAEYHEALYEEAIRLGCTVRLGCEVQTLSFDSEPWVTTTDGELITADAIIGADGLWSTSRDQLLASPTPPLPTGDLAYRLTLSGDLLDQVADKPLQELLSGNNTTVWLGPDRHCVFYPIRNRREWNLVLMSPDNLSYGVRSQQVTLDEMKNSFAGWDPRLQKIMAQGKSVLSWKLLHQEELDRWVKGNVALLGDACHPSLPYQAQGAAMALEDGITLGKLVGSMWNCAELSPQERRSYIPEMLRLYESLRKDRTSTNQRGSLSNREWYQAKEGPEMERRNKVFRNANQDAYSEWKGANVDYQQELLGFDANQVAVDAFAAWKRKILGV